MIITQVFNINYQYGVITISIVIMIISHIMVIKLIIIK